jgi:predicted peptidase
MEKRFNAWLRPVIAMLIAMLCLASGLSVYAQPAGSAGVQTAVPKSTTTAPYGYYEYLPPDYNHTGAQKFGLMIFLHGAGERGNGQLTAPSGINSLSVLLNGEWPTSYVVTSNTAKRRTYPLIVLSPQCSNTAGDAGCGWWEQSRIATFIAYAKQRYNVDTNRIYATGLSMGGAGTVYAARGATADIAAIVSICQAEGNNTVDANLVNMPMWIAHAIDDGTVGAANSWNFLNAVTAESASIMDGFDFTDSNGTPKPDIDDTQTALYNASGAASSGTPATSHRWIKSDTIADAAVNADHNIRQRLTIYRDGGHFVWPRVYNDSNIMRWLFAQRLNQAPQTCNLDVNAGGAFNIADARATLAWMLGFRGTALEELAGLHGMTGAAIDTFLQAQQTAGALDLDGDNQMHANTDGLMLLRVALGLTGAAVTDKAVNPAGSRITWDAIKTEHLIAKCKLTL